MALCEAVVRDDLAVSDECFAGVREHFSEAETVELVFVIGYQVFASKFATAFQVAPQGFSLDVGTVRGQDRKERTSPGGTATARPGQSS